MIEPAVSNPCDGLSIAQVFPPGVVAGDSFLVLGCGFGRQPVALADAAIGQARAIDYWSENLIQAPHPGGAATAQLRVVTGSGDATEPFPVTTTGVPMGGMFRVHPSWVDAINGDIFWWEDIGADEYLVKLRALGAVRATERQATTGALEDMAGKQETASKRRWAIRLGLGMALAAAAAGGAAWWRSAARLVRDQRLVGRWLRPDGGYVLGIRAARADGQLRAAHFNPRPIHIAQASDRSEGGVVAVRVELRDVHCPGSTYSLRYLPGRDRLVDECFQAGLRQTFDVEFVRSE